MLRAAARLLRAPLLGALSLVQHALYFDSVQRLIDLERLSPTAEQNIPPAEGLPRAWCSAPQKHSNSPLDTSAQRPAPPARFAALGPWRYLAGI